MANNPSNLADLTLTQIAQKGVDFINSSVAAHVFANTAMENIYQGEIEKGGRGVTQKYSDNTTGSSISVVRPLPLPIRARQLGAAINGGNFSAFEYQPASDAYDLKIITVIDDIVDIPNVTLDMIPVGISNMYIKNISDKVTLNMNAIKIAAALYTSLSAYQADPTKANVTTFVAGTDNLLKQLSKAYVQLDKGDADNGVSMFPQDDRIGLVSVDWYAEIISVNGVFNLGGANYAYDILRKGTISTDAEQNKLADGYVGTMFGIPFHTVSPLVWLVACEYLGFPAYEFDEIIALIKSAHGNLFALASGSSVKTIDCPNGQGVRLQPLYRMGAACIMPKANSLLVTGDFANPYAFKGIFNTGIEWSYKAPGSRGEYQVSVTPAASKAFTVGALTKDSTGSFTVNANAKVVANYFVQADAAITSVGAFVKAYNAAGAVKGQISTLGTSQTLSSTTAGKVVTFLIVDADGTFALASGTVLGS